MRGRQGFTLLETLAAVAVLALMAGAAVPLMTRLVHGQIRLDDERRARELIAHLDPSNLAHALRTGPVRLPFVSETDAQDTPHNGTAGTAAVASAWLTATALRPNHDPTRILASAPPRRWARVVVSDAPSGGHVLADGVVLAPLDVGSSTTPAVP